MLQDTGIGYRVDLLEACLRTPKSSITTPFKNYYCYLCNRNSTIESSKYLDAKMNISEMMIPINDERYFKFEFHIEALDIRFIKDKIINDIHLQDEFEKEKRTCPVFEWLQHTQIEPSTGARGTGGTHGPTSFRDIFALGLFDDLQDNKMDKECNKTQIFDELKNECRDIHCYPGRILTNNGCVPLLPFTSNLGYILSLTLRGVIYRMGSAETCRYSNVRTNASAHLYTYSEVSELLVCEQVEIDESEFQIDKNNQKLTLNISGSVTHYDNEYILMSDKKARLCLKDFKDIFPSQPHFESQAITLLEEYSVVQKAKPSPSSASTTNTTRCTEPTQRQHR
ncbi:unnamed protein product [Mytilus edulis]|uniref:Uncharacterized protein n=1 Tax=Mytilus edulis TaxID=6550 RepID=A0A8S3U2W4_MYTED|nr:unnamed protein product [Mytilus edulis]